MKILSETSATRSSDTIERVSLNRENVKRLDEELRLINFGIYTYTTLYALVSGN